MVSLSFFIIKGFKLALLSYFGGFAAVMGFVGLLLIAATYKKLDVAAFKSREGIVLLTVVCDGPGKEHFEAFVEQVSKRISECQ
jgi:hypothetical protein